MFSSREKLSDPQMLEEVRSFLPAIRDYVHEHYKEFERSGVYSRQSLIATDAMLEEISRELEIPLSRVKRIFILIVALMALYSNGDIGRLFREHLGNIERDSLGKAFVYGVCNEVEQAVAPMRAQYAEIHNRKDQVLYLNELYKQIQTETAQEGLFDIDGIFEGMRYTAGFKSPNTVLHKILLSESVLDTKAVDKLFEDLKEFRDQMINVIVQRAVSRSGAVHD